MTNSEEFSAIFKIFCPFCDTQNGTVHLHELCRDQLPELCPCHLYPVQIIKEETLELFGQLGPDLVFSAGLDLVKEVWICDHRAADASENFRVHLSNSDP